MFKSPPLRIDASHGDSPRPYVSIEYLAWEDMKSKCTNPSHPSYEDFGEAGAKICDEWYVSYARFLYDMGLLPNDDPNWFVERLDCTKPYSAANCRWNYHTSRKLHFSNTSTAHANMHDKHIASDAERAYPNKYPLSQYMSDLELPPSIATPTPTQTPTQFPVQPFLLDVTHTASTANPTTPPEESKVSPKHKCCIL